MSVDIKRVETNNIYLASNDKVYFKSYLCVESGNSGMLLLIFKDFQGKGEGRGHQW